MTRRVVLELRDLSVDIPAGRDRVSALARVDLGLIAGEVFGLVGESGCGKSTLANAIMGLLPAGSELTGAIRFGGRDLLTVDAEAYRQLRGNRISMIVQDPATSLDPTYSIGGQVAETIRAHRQIGRRAAKAEALALLADVGIPEPRWRYDDPPHRFSGGMRQRVVIAAALANHPEVLVADEPTTALDVTVQAQILGLITRLARERDTAVLLITHDLGVVAQSCDRVGVLYAGQLVETTDTDQLFAAPQHPYTQALLAALPSAQTPGRPLATVPGRVPDLRRAPGGCRFSPRCPHAMSHCAAAVPPPRTIGGTQVSCWLHEPRPDGPISVGIEWSGGQP